MPAVQVDEKQLRLLQALSMFAPGSALPASAMSAACCALDEALGARPAGSQPKWATVFWPKVAYACWHLGLVQYAAGGSLQVKLRLEPPLQLGGACS